MTDDRFNALCNRRRHLTGSQADELFNEVTRCHKRIRELEKGESEEVERLEKELLELQRAVGMDGDGQLDASTLNI